MRKLFLISAILCALCERQLFASLQMDNGPASNVTTTAADIYGAIAATNGTGTNTVILFYGSTDFSNSAASWASSNVYYNATNAALGTISTNITGLTPASKYFYRWYMLETTNSDWADSTSNFWTLAGVPTNTPTPAPYRPLMVDTEGDIAAPANFIDRNGIAKTSDTALLQAQVSSNDTDITSAFLQISGNDTDITSLGARVSSNDTDIASLATQVSSNDTDISSAFLQISSNDTVITALQIGTSHWDQAYSWGDHSAVGYARKDLSNVYKGNQEVSNGVFIVQTHSGGYYSATLSETNLQFAGFEVPFAVYGKNTIGFNTNRLIDLYVGPTLKDSAGTWQSEGTATGGTEIANYQTTTNLCLPIALTTNTPTLTTPRWIGDQLLIHTSTQVVYRAFGSTTNDWVQTWP